MSMARIEAHSIWYVIHFKRSLSHIQERQLCSVKDEFLAASFAHVLAAVLSLSQLVYSNSTKLNIILEAKYAHELETMYFSSDEEVNFRSDSTADLEHMEEIQTIDAQTSSFRIIDAELETHIIQALCDIEPETDVVTFKDWEEFILERASKKREATSFN